MGLAVSDLIRQLGISEQTFYRWKKQYGGLQSEQARELKQLVEENGRLKKLVAELSLDKAILQDVLSKNFQASAHEKRCRLCDGRVTATASGGPAHCRANIAQPNANRVFDIHGLPCVNGCTRLFVQGSVRISKGPHHAQA